MNSLTNITNRRAGVKPLRLVTMGDSIAAGMQNYVVTDTYQQESFSAHIARQAGADFRPPLAKAKGSPIFKDGKFSVLGALKKLSLNSAVTALPKALMAVGLTPPSFLLGLMSRAGDLSTHQSSEELTNYGIPGFEARQIRDVASASEYVASIQRGEESVDSLAQMVPSVRATLDEHSGHEKSGSQLDKVIASQPDLITITAPANDFLAAMRGEMSDQECTPFEDRKWVLADGEKTQDVIPGIDSTYRGKDGIITRLLAETDAHVMMFNMGLLESAPQYVELGKPVGELPYKVTLPGGVELGDKLANFVLPTGVKGAEDSERQSFPEGSRVPLDTLVSALSSVYIKSGFNSDKMWKKLQAADSLFTEHEVADTEEIDTIMGRVESYNQMAHELAKNPRVHIVDMHQFDLDLNEGVSLKGDGEEVKVGRSWAKTKDSNGNYGIYSEDGLHPDALGHAMVANLVLETAKQELSDLPRFESLTQAEFVDEKKIHAARRHSKPS